MPMACPSATERRETLNSDDPLAVAPAQRFMSLSSYR